VRITRNTNAGLIRGRATVIELRPLKFVNVKAEQCCLGHRYKYLTKGKLFNIGERNRTIASYERCNSTTNDRPMNSLDTGMSPALDVGGKIYKDLYMNSTDLLVLPWWWWWWGWTEDRKWWLWGGERSGHPLLPNHILHTRNGIY
jgi:hypothetical protein